MTARGLERAGEDRADGQRPVPGAEQGQAEDRPRLKHRRGHMDETLRFQLQPPVEDAERDGPERDEEDQRPHDRQDPCQLGCPQEPRRGGRAGEQGQVTRQGEDQAEGERVGVVGRRHPVLLDEGPADPRLGEEVAQAEQEARRRHHPVIARREHAGDPQRHPPAHDLGEPLAPEQGAPRSYRVGPQAPGGDRSCGGFPFLDEHRQSTRPIHIQRKKDRAASGRAGREQAGGDRCPMIRPGSRPCQSGRGTGGFFESTADTRGILRFPRTPRPFLR